MPAKYNFYENLGSLSKQVHTYFRYEIDASIYGERLSEFEIISYSEERNFLSYLLPKRILEVVLPPQVYYNILNKITPDKPFIPVTMNINMMYHINRGDDKNVEARIPFMQAEFLGLSDKTKASKEILRTKRNADSHDEGLDQVYILRLALFDIDDMNATKYGVVSGNIKGKTIEELIKHGFNACKGKSKVKLKYNKPDNKSTINNCILRATGFMDYLKFLDREYGIYESNYNVYIENGVLYVLNTEKTDKALAKECNKNGTEEIYINAYPNTNLPQMFYSFEVKDGHCQYNIAQTNLVDDEISIDNVMRDVEYTINSKGDVSKSGVSKMKLETISPTVKVDGGRHRTVTKKNRNPTFASTILIEDLPVMVDPYTIVRYLSNNRIGFCSIISSIMIISKGTMTSQLHIKSYEKFMEYEVKEKQTNKR